MATYLELFALREDDQMIAKVSIAVIVSALGVKDDVSPGADQASRLRWAAKALGDPTSMARKVYPLLLADNKGLSVAQIQGASDSAIQTQVDSAISVFTA